MPLKENGSINVSNTRINYREDSIPTEEAGEIEENDTRQSTSSYEIKKNWATNY